MNRRSIYIILSLLALITCFCIYRLLSHPDVKRVSHPPDTTISARALTEAYDNGEGHADSLFLDKTLLVSGIVNRIRLDESGRYVATLEGRFPGKTAVDCVLDSLYKADQPDLSVGDTISITGRCAGRSMNVIMTQCIIDK